MATSFLSPARTILLTSDDALYIYSSGPKGVKLVEVVPWDMENFSDHSSRVVREECASKPILILNDMVEQHYRKERVPPVSPMDKAAVVKRKLLVAFPNYPIRAALPLKEKIQGSAGVKGSIYIFSAVPLTEQLSKTIDTFKKSLAGIVGFGLLPVESSGMVKALSSKITKKGKKQSTWTIFIGQHKNGSVRQVVTKNGELALTRMTPIVDTDDDPARWVSEIHQEFKATMSYLARFGYSQADGLDVIVIANPETGGLLREAMDDVECNFKALSVSEAAKLLGLAIGEQEEDRHADVLHIAWNGRKSALTLSMKSKELDSVKLPRQAALAASVMLVGALCYFGFQISQQIPKMSEVTENIERLQRQRGGLEEEYAREAKRREGVEFNALLVKKSLAIFEELEEQNVNPLSFIKVIGDVLGEKGHIDGITMITPEKVKEDPYAPIKYGPDGHPLPGPPSYTVEILLRYPGTTDLITGNREIDALRDKIQKGLPDNKVRVSKFLKDFGYTEKFIIETGLLGEEEIDQDFIAKIEIEGPPT